MFTTPTGQTGQDAYAYEANALANAQAELDRRFQRLVVAIRTEAPGTLECSSDYAWSGADAAHLLVARLRRNRKARA